MHVINVIVIFRNQGDCIGINRSAEHEQYWTLESTYRFRIGANVAEVIITKFK